MREGPRPTHFTDAVPITDALSGRVLADTYRLVRLIGEGGAGVIWEAEHLRLPRRFAVKLLHHSCLDTEEKVARFRREAEIGSVLGHPNIVEVIDFNRTHRGGPYMVMELLEGEELASRLRRVGPMGLGATWRIVEQVTAALAATHRRKVVHRDLKPENIFLVRREDRDDFVKVLDFGVCKLLEDPSLRTRTGAILGTPLYMAPEQLRGGVPLDGRVDVFALGAITFELLSGRSAFDGASVAEIQIAICFDEPDLSALRPDLPSAVSDVLLRAMAKKPEERFPSMDAFRKALGAVCSTDVANAA